MNIPDDFDDTDLPFQILCMDCGFEHSPLEPCAADDVSGIDTRPTSEPDDAAEGGRG